MGIVQDMAEAVFWDDWESKFSLNGDSYIKPFNEAVKEEAMEIDVGQGLSDIETAKKLSSWIANNHDYKLSKIWKRPEETISDRRGDCEDYVFLLGSLLPHFGVSEFTVVAGTASSHGRDEFHVWMEVDGEVIDPTSEKFENNQVRYEGDLFFDITTEGY